jgi:hypothetical protein
VNEPEIQRADAGARRRAVLIVVFAAVAGAILIALFRASRPALERWIMRDPSQVGARLRLSFAIVVVLSSASLLGFAAYFWRLGARVVDAERFPPPGVAVFRDTPVVRGPAARRRGRLIQAAAVALTVLAILIAVLLSRIASALVGWAT